MVLRLRILGSSMIADQSVLQIGMIERFTTGLFICTSEPMSQRSTFSIVGVPTALYSEAERAVSSDGLVRNSSQRRPSGLSGFRAGVSLSGSSA